MNVINTKTHNKQNKQNLEQFQEKNKYCSDSIASRTIDFSKINKNKIGEYIQLMKEHQMNCVKYGNFIEAELAKQRVLQLRKIQERKEYLEAKKRQKNDIKTFNNNKDNELKECIKELDLKYAEEMTKLEEFMDELKTKHEKELNDYFTDFNNNYKNEMKDSNEVIEKQKQLEYYIKTEE